jgi:GLPGLI family protein
MKKLFSLLLCICAIAFAAKAQKLDSTKAIAHYKFVHLRDTTKPNDIYTENMVLFLGKTSSAYKSYDRKMQEALMRKQIAEQIKANAGAGGSVNIKSSGKGTTSNEYYQYPAQKKMVRKERLINSYLIEEPLPTINWKISSDTASFSGLKCQKATGHFAGRDYTAWFCPDLPFHSGPWKLNGLPGLIVEAYDANKQVVFTFDGLDDASKLEKPAPVSDPGVVQSGNIVVRTIGMEDANDDPGIITLPSNGIKTTEKEFTNLKAAMKKDPAAFMQSALAGSAGNFKTSPNTNVKFQVNNGPTINNPLELPEKK